ncbi:MAG: CAP family protein [Alphaproteobacteria bacterium]|nr:CAP family protein [Alphaproteobacteria bacterium]
MKLLPFIAALSLLVLPGAGSTAGFDEEMVRSHNTYRAKHGAPALKWNATIAAVAQQWAETNARESKMYHRPNNKYGENIYWMSGGKVTGAMAVNAWYGEVSQYNYSKPGFSGATGHFTQVVWKGTTEVGCGQARDARGGTYVVCNYNPPGNYTGRFPANVTPAK